LQMLIVSPDDRVEARRDERGHVECRANGGATSVRGSAPHAFQVPRAGVADDINDSTLWAPPASSVPAD
jgi:hypothetical protein